MSAADPQGIRVALLVTSILEGLGIDHHLGGSYASSIHGIPRQTQDVDLVVDLPRASISTFLEALGVDFYADSESALRAVSAKSSFNVLHLDSGIKVDLFVRGDTPFDLAEFERAIKVEIASGDGDSQRVRVKSAEDTVLRKLQWYRLGGEQSDRQWTDVLGCLEAQKEALDRAYLVRWAEDLEILDLLERALQD